MAKDPLSNTNKPLVADSTKNVLIGIPCRRDDADYRAIVRQTWMSQHGVCKVWERGVGGQPCAVTVSFVIGTDSEDQKLPTDCVKSNDCFGVVTPEGSGSEMGKKTIALFRKALRDFPWATHVAKMDMDAFPHLQEWLSEVPAGPYSLGGWMLDHYGCGSLAFCPPKECGHPINGNLLEYAGQGDTQKCWSYPQGGFYVLSRALAQGVFDESTGTCNHGPFGVEDLMVGKSAVEFARKEKLRSVATWSAVTPERKKQIFEHLGG